MNDASKAAEHAAMHIILPPALFSGLLAIASDAVIAVDDEQRIIFFNEGAERVFGWSASEVGGQYLEILLPERFRAAHRGHVHGFGAAHGHARLMGERQQISGQRKSGEEFPAEAAIERIEVNGRNVYAAILRDISARQRVENLLHQAIAARDDMLGIVSHDLRNPANAVKMLARSILEEERLQSLPSDVRERLAVIRQAAEQMDALIEDLLDMTRLEAGRLTVESRPTDLIKLVTRSLEVLQPLADAGGVTLSTSALPLLTLSADPERLVQLLSNILGNAIKFTPAGGRVALDVVATGEEVLFAVTDTGQGIDPEHLPHVFDRFFQASGTGSRARRHGAGLGLAIARGIVEAHGGRIWIENCAAGGTTVRFTLPRTPDVTPDDGGAGH